MVNRLPKLLLLAVLGVPSPALSQGDTLRAAGRDVSGCYTVHLGPWDRPVGPDAASYTPPHTVLLDSVLVTESLGGPGFRLHPQIPALTRHGTLAPEWWRTAPDSVRLRWTSGFVGVAMQLGRVGRDLVGRAEAFSDEIFEEVLPDGSRRARPWPTAPVELRRVQCP